MVSIDLHLQPIHMLEGPPSTRRANQTTSFLNAAATWNSNPTDNSFANFVSECLPADAMVAATYLSPSARAFGEENLPSAECKQRARVGCLWTKFLTGVYDPILASALENKTGTPMQANSNKSNNISRDHSGTSNTKKSVRSPRNIPRSHTRQMH